MGKPTNIVYGLVSAAAIAIGVAACVTSPETGRTQLSLVSDSQMNSLGAQAYEETLAKAKISRNTALNNEVTSIGRRIAQASGVDYDWEFTVIDEPQTVNAFCLPGGKVAVYTGIIPVAKNNAALAAVMGHEVAHATLRHSAERMSQQLVMQMGLTVASITFSDSKNRNMIAGLLGIGTQFGVVLPFSRYHESEADRVGLEYMAKAGYDPREAVGLWERMGSMGGGRPPEILSTHPDPARRAKELSKHMPKALAMYQASPMRTPTKNL
ncbi:MAG TPA: M48 family metallopeptidase [Oligoflexus sp.]|uniref:M48 family metallopeptidase n=1 Tax=Oligoflexus sp. TaxID=1971216 RepID=UPI002D807CB0|nr:M48 family metallopeptidase [Oligoflexus sp.]HET9239813.1 M48 family metallopeptidase [Oligoflexus sp.]